jgi:hypothetical protein
MVSAAPAGIVCRGGPLLATARTTGLEHVSSDVTGGEQISPELVLVDPELAARLRAAWVERVHAGPPRAEPAPVVVPPTEDQPAPKRFELTAARLRRGALTLSLLINALLLASMWNGRADGRGSVSDAGADSLASAAEVAILRGLGDVPALSRLFVDPATGLPFPHVSAQCEPPAVARRPAPVHCVVWRGAGRARVTRSVVATALAGTGFRLSASP